MEDCLVLYLKLGNCASSFNFEKAVCNHGFFMMPPNHWIHSTKTLQRPLRLTSSSHTSVTVSISHPIRTNSIRITIHHMLTLSSSDKDFILKQVARMLRISYKDQRDLLHFQQMHPHAKIKGFGRLFRSPTLFEDVVKSILLCNCMWERSLKMAKSLCELQSEITQLHTKRKRCNNVEQLGNFPSSKELVGLTEDFLQKRCNLGYRAKQIIEIAQKIESRKLQLHKFDKALDEISYNTVYEKLMKIKGFGPFTCANIMMCIGSYKRIPADTETVRHLQEVHGKECCSKATIEQDVKEFYDKYAPFQCLAYWMELLEWYENKVGKLSELANSDYHRVSGSFNFKTVKEICLG